LVNFLLLIEKIPEYIKKTIDTGLTPQNVYELCSCIREAFCLSYSIRKKNNLYLYFQDDHVLVKFLGNKLRYLGPDERSQALLLEKALKHAKDLKNLTKIELKKSTPGIYFTRFNDLVSFIRYLNSINAGSAYLILENEGILNEEIKVLKFDATVKILNEDNFYIIPTYTVKKETSIISTLITELKNIKCLSLSKIKPIENKILYINFRKDYQETLK
jgi:hypothetical protein